MAQTDIAALVNQMPELDTAQAGGRKDSTGKLTGITWEKAIPIYEAILAAGRDGIMAVLGMLKPVDNGEDYKARYTLHGMAMYVCRSGKEKERALYVETMASQLGTNLPKPIQAFIVQQLQFCGDRTAVPALGKVLLDEELGDPAAAALTAIRDGAAEQFRAALPQASGRRKLAVVQALGVLRDTQSVAALKEAASDQNLDTRIVATWGLANIGDAGSVDIVLKASNADGWERIQGVKSCLILAERLAAAGDKESARRIYTHLRDTRTDPKEQYVREVAQKALAALQ